MKWSVRNLFVATCVDMLRFVLSVLMCCCYVVLSLVCTNVLDILNNVPLTQCYVYCVNVLLCVLFSIIS